MERREFLQQLALFGAAVASFRCKSEPPAPDLRPPPARIAGAALTAAQQAGLAAACNRILPGDASWPSASAAGVIEFAASELRRPELGEIRTRLLGGLLALDRRAARLRPDARFATLEHADQDRL